MLAIIEERDRFRDKHRAEDAQMKLNEIYESGLNTD